MDAEIFANGDEITTGIITDTNTPWLSRELTDLGIAVRFHTAVDDEFDDMVSVLRIAMKRVGLIIWTGGLGPTPDDLTREAFAAAAGVPLIQDPASLQHLESIMQRRGGQIVPNALSQTYLPQGAVKIFNPRGTAPGIDLTVKRADVFPGEPIPEGRLDFIRMLAFPGVPAEMMEMWHHSGRQMMLTMLDSLRGERRIFTTRAIHAFGMGESQVANLLSDILQRDHIPQVGITATQGTITLRIIAEAATEEEGTQINEPVARRIYEVLGERVFGEGEDTLADVVCRIVNAQDKKIAVVEAGTRGLLAKALGSSKESATCFLGGVVLPPRRPVAPDRMIEVGRKMFDADYLLLIGAYPEGQPDRTRSDETFVAVINAKDLNLQTSVLQMRNFPFVGHPAIIDDLYVKRVLDIFRLHFAVAGG